MSDDLLQNPANFPELMLVPHLDDDWTEVSIEQGSDDSWEVYVHVRVDAGYPDREQAQAVADYYRENLQAYLAHQKRRGLG